jgi:rod shape-determining protein MreD
VRPADLTPVARDVLKLPAGPGLILASFLAAFLFNSLPWSGWALAARPDLVMLVLVFWAIHQPGSVGQGIAFAAGLAMDVGDSMLLGQHALAYVLATYGAQVLRVRVLSFPIVEQTLHVLGLAIGASAVIVLLNLLLGTRFPGVAALLSPVLAALAWGPLTWLLYLPSLRRPRHESPA